MKKAVCVILLLGVGTIVPVAQGQVQAGTTGKPAQISQAVPYPTLDPPPGITPAQSREPFSWSLSASKLPKQTWTPQERKAYEARMEWFHNAKFGIFFHFLAGWQQWNSEKWNKWVDAVDVEKIADQAKEIGAGYVVIALGQNHLYSCAPNPVLDELWHLQPGQYTSRRDLPMDLYAALQMRGVAMMLYLSTDHQYKLPRPADCKGTDRYENWVKVAQWYSDHYGTRCKGWWVDGLDEDWTKDYRIRIHRALKHGNPGALVTSNSHEISDYLHGHCMVDWDRQRTVVKPFFGRWDPDFNNQWHVFLHVGHVWAESDTPKKTQDLVQYAFDVVRGGGVITFDLGMTKMVEGKLAGPFLEIQPGQFEQMKAVGTALRKIPVSDGRGTPDIHLVSAK